MRGAQYRVRRPLDVLLSLLSVFGCPRECRLGLGFELREQTGEKGEMVVPFTHRALPRVARREVVMSKFVGRWVESISPKAEVMTLWRPFKLILMHSSCHLLYSVCVTWMSTFPNLQRINNLSFGTTCIIASYGILYIGIIYS